MDEDRRVRFFVAPVLLIASLLWGALLDQNCRQHIFDVLKRMNGLSALIGFAAAGGFAVFAFGYVIGTFTYFTLGMYFRLRAWLSPAKSRFHEVSLSDDSLERVWVTLNCSGAYAQEMDKRKQELSAVVAFDHGLIRENYRGVHL
jgi:hypothetical protein